MTALHKTSKVILTVPAQADFLSVVRESVEKGAALFGLAEMNLMGLSLAVEEIFLHLCRVSGTGESLSLSLAQVATGVDLEFTIKAAALSIGGLNVVTGNKVESLIEQEDFNQIGLLLAAGFIDHFSLRQSSAREYSLLLRQERGYPEASVQETTKQRVSKPPFSVVSSAPAELLEQACLQVLGLYPAYLYAPFYRYPGKFSDLIRGDELSALVVIDTTGAVCGLISWIPDSGGAIRFHGPYVFSTDYDDDIATLLVDEFIGQVVRTSAKIVFTSQATNALPMNRFELLGTLDYYTDNKECTTLTSCYYHLREDHGLAVWAHPELADFLEKEYERLFLPREIRLTTDHGGERDEASVFGLKLNKKSGLAIITPLLDGMDIQQNMSLHLQHLVSQQISNILCIIDVGHGWQAQMSGVLLQQGFTPRLVQPLAGKGDCVVFQYASV